MTESYTVNKRCGPLRFLLAGVHGMYNYGCEAIVRGTIRMLREQWPDCHITLASNYIIEDSRILRDIERLTVVDLLQRFTISRVGKGLLRRCGFGSGSPLPFHRQLLRRRYDASLSIGGDNYSLNAQRTGVSHFVSELTRWGDKSLLVGRKHVLWGASVGPFEGCPDVCREMSLHLRRISLITAREPTTHAYLHQLGCCNNTVLVADPAFAMEPSTDTNIVHRKSEHTLIAINLSELALRQLFPGDTNGFNQCKGILKESLKRLAQMPHVQVILVPHVTGYGFRFDDYDFMMGLRHDISAEIEVVPSGLGARQTKALLASCDLVIAARMHCAVAALSMGIPTILLAYSTKGVGLSEYVYGSQEYALWLDRMTPQVLLEKVQYICKHRSELCTKLSDLQGKWQSDARKAVTALQRLLEPEDSNTEYDLRTGIQ